MPSRKELRELKETMLRIDPTGALLAATMLELRLMLGRAIERKSSGWHDSEIEAVAAREQKQWFAKGPRRIITEFHEYMEKNP